MVTTSLAFVFPGQGSQSVAMLSDIAPHFPEVEATYAEASEVLGYDLWKLVQEGPIEALDKTIHTQPALLAASCALWRITKSKKNFKPVLLAGHSLGEYSALVCANAISFSDGIRLVAARGHYMQDAVPVGVSGLAAIIGLDEMTIQTICEKSVSENEVLSPANFNCPGQIVIAGHLSALEKALVLAKEAGARMVKLLPVSVSSHCALMKPAAERLAVLLAETQINNPMIPVVSNVDVVIYDDPQAIRDGLVRQLYMPVRWVESMQLFANKGITHVVECGPGKVLSGLIKRINANIRINSLADIVTLEDLSNGELQ